MLIGDGTDKIILSNPISFESFIEKHELCANVVRDTMENY